MLTYPLHIAFSGYAIIGLTLLILSAGMTGYLMSLASKTPLTWSLIPFFGMLALSGVATILGNGMFYWDRLFIPWQDFWVLAAGAALSRLPYRIPLDPRPREAKVVFVVLGGIALLALCYCIIFDYLFLIEWTPGLGVSDAFYVLLPLGTLLVVLIFLRRSVQLSALVSSELNHPGLVNAWKNLIHPQGEDAQALRSLGIALSLAFLPGLQTLFHFPGNLGFILTNIGAILAVTAIALVYFNYASEGTTFSAKLVGVTLSSLLLIFAIFAALDTIQWQSHLGHEQTRVITAVRNALIEQGTDLVGPFDIAYVVSWDAKQPDNAGTYQQIFRADDEVVFDLDTLMNQNREGYLDSIRQGNDESWFIERYWTFPRGSSHEDYNGYIFFDEGRAYEIGVSNTRFSDSISSVVARWLILILISTAFVLLVFPVFFNRTLALPLENLLAGIRQVNRGDLETRITPRFMDEIGFITLSFNQMVSSLSEATSALEMERSNLEVQIKNRTSDLININTRLEEEVRHRRVAEWRLSQQLRYEIALFGCSQSLLAAASDKGSQQVVLERALQFLLTGARASRAYICRVFEDPELGTSISLLAEVCAPGIPGVINVPGPRKLAIATFPAEFMETLSNGDPFGGPVKALFADSPLLQTYLLNQQPQLLSLMILPIVYHQKFWGLIGFDDCITERKWESAEISLLGTASGMISNTLHRWETQSKLKATLDELEERVEERTTELSLSNRQLNQEIIQRQKIQHDLEIRLQVEEILANISTRLLASSNSRDSMQVTLHDLARIVEAGRIFLVEFDSQTIELRDFAEWHSPETQPVSRDIVINLLDYLHEFSNPLSQDETFYIEDTTHATNLSGVQMRVLHERNVKSIVLVPLTIDGNMFGILGCTNLTGAPEQIRMNLRVLDLVAGMLKGLLQREYLIQTLEDQVVERTRQLTTFLDVAMLGDQAQDLTDILQPTLLSITQIVNCDAATIHFFQEESSRLKMLAQRGIPLDFMQPLQEIELDSRAIDSLKAPGSSSSWGTREMDPNLLKPFQISGYHGLFLTHMTDEPSIFSILSCYRAGDRAFSHFETTLVTALTELVGIIVENSRLRSEAEELAVFEERQRLAREIHDAVSQSVYSLSLFARSAQDALGESNESKLLASLQDIEGTALGAMREMRLLLYQLNTEGQVTDIAAALDARFRQVENRLGIQATCEVEAGLDLPKHLQHEIWRVLIEALNNAVKHAHPTQVHVQIALLEEALLVSVQDDGVGFQVRNDSAGMGLKNIQIRVETLGGILKIITSPGHGTQIKIMIPAAQPDLQEGG